MSTVLVVQAMILIKLHSNAPLNMNMQCQAEGHVMETLEQQFNLWGHWHDGNLMLLNQIVVIQ